MLNQTQQKQTCICNKTIRCSRRINSSSGHVMLPAARLRDRLSVTSCQTLIDRWYDRRVDVFRTLLATAVCLLNKIIKNKKGSCVVSCSDKNILQNKINTKT